MRGDATNTAVVTVNGKGVERDAIAADSVPWHFALEADNANGPDFPFAEITAVVNPPGTNTPDIVSLASGHLYAPPQNETLTYDADGNLLTDGRWQYTWNGENRLIKAETRDDLPASVPRMKVEYAYDHQGRMVWKEISRGDAETRSWEIEQTASVLWDGYNIVSTTVHHSSFTNHNFFTWGLDLSGSLQGAGGVGGLFAEIQDGVPYFAAFDANGNVTEYLSADGALATHYEYSPFGEIVVQSGPMADSFTHRFSTKPWCAVTGLSEYLFRKYNPSMGGWLSRDPIGESGGPSLYGFLLNQTTYRHDKLGLFLCELCCPNQCSRNQRRLRDMNVRVLPNGFDPTGLDPSDIGYGGFNQANIIVTAVGDGVSAGAGAGPIVGVSAGAISFVMGELTPSAGAISEAMAGVIMRSAFGTTGAKVWTRVVYNPCWLNQSCLGGLCKRNMWGSNIGGEWRQCSIRAELHTVDDPGYTYYNKNEALAAAAECLAAHIALVEGRQ